jgi:hypothetical protein
VRCQKAFWFHYNKPASQRVGKPQITIHINNQCHIVDNIIVDVPTRGRIRKQQPYFVMAGKTEHGFFIGQNGNERYGRLW